MATLTRTVPSYLYQQYQDDDSLQAFVDSYNTLTQKWVNTFNALSLPVYTGDLIAGLLLDWVGAGLYGYPRPVLPSDTPRFIGPYNTWEFNQLEFNGTLTIGPTSFNATTDDIYKRCITWHFYKGDGKVFNIRWLKRRIMRFLIGTNGTAPNIDQTYQISVTFGTDHQVNIRILLGVRRATGGAFFNGFEFNGDGAQFNSLITESVAYPPVEFAATFKAGVDALALELPFQYDWIVAIENIASLTGFYNNSGTLALFGFTVGWPTTYVGLPAGSVWSDGLSVAVVPGVVPNPAAPPVYYGIISAAQLLLLGGGNLPLTAPATGSGQLWNNAGQVSIA